MTADAFSVLHPRVQEGLEALGIDEPTPPQERAIRPIMEGENVLLVAPTASGKTEAALLPVFDALMSEGQPPGGIEVVYITPLRALNRDIHKRLIFWGEHLGVGIEVRHGDTTRKQRRHQSARPPRLLITTPETLQAILPSKAMREHLETVRWVIVDEIHELASSKRGIQLTLGLERLQHLAHSPVQRIGLSATVGNPYEVAAFLGGPHQVTIIEVEIDKRYSYDVEFPEAGDEDFDLASDLGTTPEAAARLRRIMGLVGGRRSTLIFVQGRGQAESLGHKLRKINPLIEVHHGSLSREQRHLIEDRFKAGELKGIICTSTLQLGIDIGDVDLTVQYLSPRQVSTLIQRVGRSGHTLSRLSEGVILSAYGEDALESLVATLKAREGELERTEFHIGAGDVLAHQLIGLAMDEEGMGVEEAYRLVTRAYPYRELTMEEFREHVDFLREVGLLRRRDDLNMRKKGSRYYYENLGMINDERRYPFIDVVTDRVIGTVGDEFWALRARRGLNVILKGRVWRIIQIDEERGVLHVLPSEDPLGALPGWDGELIPVPRDVAQEVGDLREEIAKELEARGSKEDAIEAVSERLKADPAAIEAAADEVKAHLGRGFPIPTKNRILLEVYDRYLIIHSGFGERVNRTLGAVFDALLSDHDLIYSWWNDPYRILVEAPRRLDKFDLEKFEELLVGTTGEDAKRLVDEFIRARWPFGYRMKFIAERFGVIPRGKTLNARSLENLYVRFKDTPIYRETLREVHQEKLDLESLREILAGVGAGDIEVVGRFTESPSPLAKHILEQYADVAELMEETVTGEDQLEYMKKTVMSRRVKLVCMDCGEWSTKKRVREIDERPTCGNCGSGLLAVLRRYHDLDAFMDNYDRLTEGEELDEDEREALIQGRKTADMVLSYGRRAVEALMVRGVGPATAHRVLSRMQRDENRLYADLLKAKIQYMRTRQYWDEE
ncbi:MAG: DEAD/DEAH box helicase [Candidatus Bathyarchaeota archaeon]|jgi:ATP-dependent Lhr-like helicase